MRDRTQREDQERRAVLRAIAGSRLVRYLALFGLLGTGTLVIGTAYFVSQATSLECEDLEQEDLSIDDIVSLKDRTQAYQREPSSEAWLELSGSEASFLLRDEAEYGLWLRPEGDRLGARVTAPLRGICYNIEYEGSLDVEEGTAVLVPERLVVGSLDITPLMGGREYRFEARDVPDPVLARHLQNTERLEVRDGLLRLRFMDRWSIW